MEAAEGLRDLQKWLHSLGHEISSKSPVEARATIGVVMEGVVEAEQGTVLIWEAGAGEDALYYRQFTGWASVRTDLFFVVDDTARMVLVDTRDGTASMHLKEMLRHGHVLFYSLTAEPLLQDKGFGDFLEDCGVGFLGACR